MTACTRCGLGQTGDHPTLADCRQALLDERERILSNRCQCYYQLSLNEEKLDELERQMEQQP